MLRHLKLKMKIKVKSINNCLPVYIMESYQKNINLFELSWTLKNIKLNALSVYDDRCLKTNIRTCSDKVYTNFRGLNVPEDGREWE